MSAANMRESDVHDGPYGHQLVHGLPGVEEYWDERTALSTRPSSYETYMANPGAGLIMYAGRSSAAYHIKGIPIETLAHLNANFEKYWLRVGNFGFIEVNDDLFDQICPADLSNSGCVFDETFVWDAEANKWRGGCQKLRVCGQINHIPRPAPPPLSPYQYIQHVDPVASAALTKIQNIDPRVVESFKPATYTANEVPAMLLATRTETSQNTLSNWPVIVSCSSVPGDPAHRASCLHLHDILPTCRYVAAMKTIPFYHGGFPLESCGFGHDFPGARARASARATAHRQEAAKLATDGNAVRAQRTKDGRVLLWVCVPEYTGIGGTKGQYLIDGTTEIRANWAVPHLYGVCPACGPGADNRYVRKMGEVEEEAMLARAWEEGGADAGLALEDEREAARVLVEEWEIEEGLKEAWKKFLAGGL